MFYGCLISETIEYELEKLTATFDFKVQKVTILSCIAYFSLYKFCRPNSECHRCCIGYECYMWHKPPPQVALLFKVLEVLISNFNSVSNVRIHTGTILVLV